MADQDRLSKIIVDAKPNWPPGTQVGHHAFTHGWVLNQLVRRVDAKKRTIGQYYRDEILSKMGGKSNESSQRRQKFFCAISTFRW